jgi:hypothetical protein
MLDLVIEQLGATEVADVVDGERRRQLVPYSRTGRVRSALGVDGLTQASVLRWVTVMPRMQSVDDDTDGGDRVRVLLADRILRLPRSAVPAVDALALAPGGMRIADLPWLDPASRLVVGRRLVIEGACVVDA